MVNVSVNAPYGINPKNGKPYTYWQAIFDESSDTAKAAQNDYWDTLKAGVTGASAGVNEMLGRVAQPSGSFDDPLLIPAQGAYGLSDFLVGYKNHPTKYKTWYQQMEEEPLFHRYLGKDDKGNSKYELKMETIPEFITKLYAHRQKRIRDELENLVVANLDEDGKGGTGASGISLPGVGAMPNLPKVDWQAIRDRINNLDIDTNYEAPQKDPLVMIGQALANIDLTSNLVGDWSKTAKIAADFQQYNEEQAKNAKNKSADKKAELALWKAMKDIALQEAEANEAMKQAEFGMRWKQLQMQAAMNQAKANAFYSMGGGGIESSPSYQDGMQTAIQTLQKNPNLKPEDVLAQKMKANLVFKNAPKEYSAWRTGYTAGWDWMQQKLAEQKAKEK